METITARLQTPADDDGVRKNVNLITDATAVSVKADDTRSMSLQDRLDEIGGGTVLSANQPNRACVWFQIKSEEND